MKAWILDRSNPDAPTLGLQDVAEPKAGANSVLVRMEAVPLLSYTRAYLQGKLPYAYPADQFTPGTNGVGHIIAVGVDVQHLQPGQRVAVNPHWVANEAVTEPAQILIGLTGISADSASMLKRHPHGTLREVVEFPASTLIPLDGLEHLSAERLSLLAKLAVPFGGLRRGRLAAGETVIVNGASGYFGSAAVIAALAMGAGKVIALGRRLEALQSLVDLGQQRVVALALTGDLETDIAAVRQASGGGANLSFDMVGQAHDANATLVALKSLRRGGRLVLMGSMTVDLPLNYSEVLINNWEVIGNFMYTPADYLALVSLARAGLLPLEKIKLHRFGFEALEAAIDKAENMGSFDSAVVGFL